jgi:hypothetical protein
MMNSHPFQGSDTPIQLMLDPANGILILNYLYRDTDHSCGLGLFLPIPSMSNVPAILPNCS